jgi:hypothetical protein
VTIHYVPQVKFYSFLDVFTFHLFSNTSKIGFRSNHIWFCVKFQALSFDKKRYINHRDNRGKILKILRGQLFMGHPSSSYVENLTASMRLKAEDQAHANAL